jgi:Predicted Zn-dependent protease (DUF2268)
MKCLKLLILSPVFFILPYSIVTAQSKTADVKFITADIDNFWQAYDACQNKVYTEKVNIFDSLYIKRASSCLKSILQSQNLNAETFIKWLETEKDYFSKCRKVCKEITSYEPEIKKHLLSFKNIYPNANLGDVYFMFTAFYTGGQPHKAGIAIGMDFWGKPEYDSVQFTNPLNHELVRTIDNMPFTVMHEQTHRNQKQTAENTLLKKCLEEGGADFIAYLITGKVNNTYLYNWGNSNETELKQHFKKDIATNNYEYWLYNKFSPDRPRDLGYYIGFKICESYYNNSKNRTTAVADILNIKKSGKFLKKSHYL